jgi:hypothetical protein
MTALRRSLTELADLDRTSKHGVADAVDGMFGIVLGLA